LSAGHARALIGIDDAEQLARRAMQSDMSVRQLENEVRADRMRHAPDAPATAAKRAKPAKDADTRALEKRVSDALGLEVTVDHRGEGGTLHVKYRDLDQLDVVLRKLGG
jgi:ParB family chromosome partitioning protein